MQHRNLRDDGVRTVILHDRHVRAIAGRRCTPAFVASSSDFDRCCFFVISMVAANKGTEGRLGDLDGCGWRLDTHWVTSDTTLARAHDHPPSRQRPLATSSVTRVE